MKETWGFDIGTGASALHYSFESFTYEGVPYYNRIIPESFSGVIMRVDMETKLFAPNEASFDISNNDSSLVASDIEGLKCCISQLLNGVLNRSWTFIIETATPLYGKICCTCVDPVSKRLQGTFPVTSTLAANFPSGEVHEEDTYHVPVTLGTAYIPCASFLYSGIRYYVLNKLPATCTIIKVRSPRSWDFVTEWDNSYNYVQSDKTGDYESVRAVRLEIADSDNDGTIDAYGVWSKSGKMLSPLINFTGANSSTTKPGSWILKILELFGVTSGYLDSMSFTAVDSALSGVTWGGGFWKTEEKESVLASLLSQCDCFLSVGTTVSLNLFSATSIETLNRNKIKEYSYSASPLTKNASDGGTVKFVWDGEPQDELTGKAIVGLYNAAPTPSNPSNDAFEYKYDYNNVNAQKFGKLYFQKKYDQRGKVRFTTEVEALTTRATIVPGKVITISDTQSNGFQAYGGPKSIVITSLTFKRGLEIDVEGTFYRHLEDFSSVTATEITPDTDLGGDFQFLSLTKIVTISGQNVFHYATGETVPTPTSVTLTAMLYGGLTTYNWEYWNGSAWANLSGTRDTREYTLAYNNPAWSVVGTDTLRVRCKSGDYWGETTVTKMSDGANGTNGTNGVVNLGIPQMNDELQSVVGTGAYRSVTFGLYSHFAIADVGFEVGDILGFSVLAKITAGNSAPVQCYVGFKDINGVAITSPAALTNTTNTTNSYVRIFRNVEIPVGAVYVLFGTQTATLDAGKYIWAKQGMVYRGNIQPEYTPCVRDSKSIEFIFRQGTETPPATPATSQVDDYVPSGWTDESQGVSSVYPVEWVSERRKSAFGIWGDFSTPSVWARYAADGATGAGVTYRGLWATGVDYVGTSWVRDIVKVGATYYICQTSHTSGTWATDLAAGKWVSFSNQFASVATDILLVQDVAITRSMTFSGGASFLNVIGSDGLVINAEGGLKVNAGGSLRLLSAAGTPAMVRFVTGTNILNIGAIHATDNLTFWGDTANSADLVFGYAANALITQRFRVIYNYVYNTFSINQENPTGDSYLTAYNGILDLTASQYILLDAPFIRGTNVTDIGHPSTSSYRFRSIYLTGNIGSAASPIGSIYCGAITAGGALTGVTALTMSGALTGATSLSANYLNAALNVLPTADGGASLGSTALRFAYANVNNLRIYNGANYALINNVFSSAGTRATPAGYLTVVINGATRYIQLYSA